MVAARRDVTSEGRGINCVLSLVSDGREETGHRHCCCGFWLVNGSLYRETGDVIKS